MGYSCTVEAGNMLAVIEKMCGAIENKDHVLRIDGKKYFFERGKEQADGAVTGTLMVMLDDNYCRKAGSVRINPDGTIARFPKFTAKDKAEAERILRTTDHNKIRNWAYGVL
jgi:hypothetical protein